MWGPPKDVEGECGARLFVADDYGDNSATLRCGLEPGHEGLHMEKYDAGDEDSPNKVSITWAKDQSRICPECKKRCREYEFNSGETLCWNCEPDEEE